MFRIAPSGSKSRIFFSMPPAQPVRLPFAPTMRRQGTRIEGLFFPTAPPTACADIWEGRACGPAALAGQPRLRASRACGPAALAGRLRRQLAVGRRAAVGDAAEQLPHLVPERAAREVQRRAKVRLPSRKIDIWPALSFGRHRMLARLICFVRRKGEGFLFLKSKPGQSGFVRREQNVAERGFAAARVPRRQPFFPYPP